MRKDRERPITGTRTWRVAAGTELFDKETAIEMQRRTAMSATLRLTRDVGSACFELRRGRFEILVDGKPVGSLANHDRAEIQIEPGRHNLALRKSRYSS